MRLFVLLAAASLAAPLVAQPLVASDATGPLSGRSPHKVMRVASAAPACGKTMHSIPAGKLPTYGLHAFPRACADVEVARADLPKGAERAE
ncbi:hypothetical protein [Sphingomonas nostoxanthinifaciens]|uniref:hypothetical protein n=1 Tax=Sphingomonas nostoxanthinifaciens TaxID=2872652 RepID=UPI001CC1FBBB|nr:hypothetical protein [Sphingomonas nostoxanthinifaciens]UAK25087.1 hypothetical protein K8P63_02420 [Sphingomonas nostoxanthinifaciens]